MNNEPASLFDLAPKRLQWLSTRQRVVAENIANADVKGYRASDVESFSSYLARENAAASSSTPVVTESDLSWGNDMSNNNVVLEEQIMEANATAGQFRIATSLYRKAHEMLHAVAGRR